MIKAAIVISPFYKNNRLFDIRDPISNKDNCIYSSYLLRQELLKKNIDLSTHDINTISESEIVIFNEMPKRIPQRRGGQRFYLLAIESIAVHPINFDVSRYYHFDKVFTWKDDLVDHKRVIKINYSFLFNTKLDMDLTQKKRLICLVANNKRSKHPQELYSERIKVIKWFEKNHPSEFDLYGAGWNEFEVGYVLRKLLKVFNIPFIKKNSICYRGVALQKILLLREYKFNICYENVRDIPGYITEKIFDCFFAGCVPIYLGANNVTDHIPKNCFIDKREFDSYEKLYEFIKGMDDTTYQQYLNNAQEYLNSPISYEFTAECYAKTISKEVLNG